MRVITGTARGRKLKAPAGTETRPTSDRIKEALFNIIQFDIEGRQVLDLFAGTGQLGIEALSRGAASAVFIDSSREAAEVIRDNLTHTNLDGAKVLCRDVLAYLSSQPGPFDLIFCDPPYHSGDLAKALALVVRFDILREGGIMVCETDDVCLPPVEKPYRAGRIYTYGTRRLALFHRDAAGDINR